MIRRKKYRISSSYSISEFSWLSVMTLGKLSVLFILIFSSTAFSQNSPASDSSGEITLTGGALLYEQKKTVSAAEQTDKPQPVFSESKNKVVKSSARKRNKAILKTADRKISVKTATPKIFITPSSDGETINLAISENNVCSLSSNHYYSVLPEECSCNSKQLAYYSSVSSIRTGLVFQEKPGNFFNRPPPAAIL